MILRDMTPGTRFKFPYCGKTGVVVSHGEMGSRIIYDGATRQVQLRVTGTDEEVAFEAPGKPVIVSGGSVVELFSPQAAEAPDATAAPSL